MQCHADDLRVEIGNDWEGLTGESDQSRDRKGAVEETPGRGARSINPVSACITGSGLTGAPAASNATGPLPHGRGSDQAVASDQFDVFVHQAVDDWRRLPLRAGVRALFEHAEKLTLRPSECTEADIEVLRGHGCQDKDIHDAVQVAAYFNYINRIADGLGVELEADHPRWGSEAKGS